MTLQTHQGQRGGLGIGTESLTQRSGAAVVPTSVTAPYIPELRFADANTITQFRARVFDRRLLQRDNRVHRWFQPAGRARLPRPRSETDVAILLDDAQARKPNASPIRFDTGDSYKPIHAFLSGFSPSAACCGQRDAQRSSPARHIDLARWSPASIGKLPRREHLPRPIRCRFAMESHGRVSSWLQPGFFPRKISPAPVRVLAPAKCVEAQV
jgi:hypothetical protein